MGTEPKYQIMIFSRYLALIFMAIMMPANVYAVTLIEAEKSYQDKNYNKAIKEINTILLTDPENTSALFLRAQVLADNLNVTSAIENYNQLIKIAPHHIEAYNNLAVLYAQKNQLLLASKTLEDAIQSDPTFNTIYRNLRSLYLDLSKKHYQQALKLKPVKKQTRLTKMSTQTNASQTQ